MSEGKTNSTGQISEEQRTQIFDADENINKTQVPICWGHQSSDSTTKNTKLGTRRDYQGQDLRMNGKKDTSFIEQTNKDDDIIFEQYLQRGSKWTEICKYVKGRSQNCVKNKFYGTLRKVLRKINEIGKKHLKKFSKPLKFDALMRVIEAKWRAGNLPHNLQLKADQLAIKSINFCRCEKNIQNKDLVIEYIHDFLRFNLQSRCYRLKKRSKKETQSKKTKKSRQLGAQQIDNSFNKICRQFSHPSTPKTDQNSLSSSVSFNQNIIRNGSTKQNILNKMEQEYFSIDEVSVHRTMRNVNSFEDQFCEILGIQYIPSSCLLQQFF